MNNPVLSVDLFVAMVVTSNQVSVRLDAMDERRDGVQSAIATLNG